MVPTEADFQAHGLMEVELDPITSTTAPGNSPQSSSTTLLGDKADKVRPDAVWLSGWAKLHPTPDYATILDTTPGTVVRWNFCPQGSQQSMLSFRRQAQVKALDTVPHTLAQSAGSSSPIEKPALKLEWSRRRYRPPAQIVAWWEDSLGYWLVVEQRPAAYRPMVDAWAEVVGHDWPQKGTRTPNTPLPIIEDQPIERVLTNSSSAGASQEWWTRWADACDLLAQVVTCLQALHDRHLSLNWCHPSSFVMLGDSIVANRLWHATALPGLSLSSVLTPELASSILFTQDPIHHSSYNLSEGYLFGHLRYLAPEAAISRRVSPSNDIYGWGVFAYELLTGTTIDGTADSPDHGDIDLLADVHRHVTNVITSPAEYLEDLAAKSSEKFDLPPLQLSEIIMVALAKDPEDRYHSLEPLAYDLRKLSQICRAQGDLSKFNVAEVDRMSRFNLPQQVIERGPELEALQNAFNAVATGAASSRIVAVWGHSGTGKTRLVNEWANAVETSHQGNRCLVGSAQPDEHVRKPLASFFQVIQSLLDRVLTDPREDSKGWLQRIRSTLGTQWRQFASLLSEDSRRLINEDSAAPPTIETEKFLASFRSWSRRFLQLFGTQARPLVLIIDDTQWLAPDEMEIWRDILDGPFPLNHVVVISMTRTYGFEPPPPSALLSASSMAVHVPRLTEEGVTVFINACLNHRVASQGDVVASFLYGETGGSLLFLQTLMTTLLKEHVVAFDYDSLLWRFDLVALQSHLSDESSYDAYLENMMKRQPMDVQELLMLMAYLPAAGFPLRLLACIARMNMGEVENLVQLGMAAGTLALRNSVVRFTHDRQRLAAQTLIPPHEAGQLHQRIFNFLCGPKLQNEYLFEALDHALMARKLGTDVAKVDHLTTLLLDAAERATLSANFSAAKNLVCSAQDIVDETGGLKEWTIRYRALCFRFVRLFTEVASVFHEHDSAFAKLELVRPLCRTSTEKIMISTLLTRQLIAANQHLRAVDQLLVTLDEFGYNPEKPKAVELWYPTCPQDIEELGAVMRASTPASDDEDHVLIMSLISYAGPTIYVTHPELRVAIFRLGLSVAKALGRMHKSASYILAVQCVTIENAAMQRALITLSKEICDLYPSSLFTSCSLILVAAQGAFFHPREKVAHAFEEAFEASINLADYEVAAYVVALDLATLLSASVCPGWETLAKKYEMVKPYATNSHRVLTNVLLQGWENLSQARMPSPWKLNGPFFTRHDLELIRGLKFQPGVVDTVKLRLLLLYDAPVEIMSETLKHAKTTFMSTFGLPVSTETRWLMAMAQLRLGGGTDLVDACRRFLKPYTLYSPDLRARYGMLTAFELVLSDPLGNLPTIESHIDTFDEGGHHLLSGLLNYYVADTLLSKTGSPRLVSGFVRSSYTGFRLAETYGLCESLARRFPNDCPVDPLPARAPSNFFRDPQLSLLELRRESTTTDATVSVSSLVTRSERTSTTTTATTTADLSDAQQEANSAPTDSLDTLALMRSSLALAQEKDSLVLLCTLLRILCQFTRCEYAAIALSSEENRSTFRLKAAGPFQRIVSYDLDLANDSAGSICPATIMLHVARTGVPIRKNVTTARLRNDPFFNDRQPRTLLCLPIHHQGVPSGVIVLLSINSTSSATQSDSACEVVTTLATFATVIHVHHVFTKHLKTEVAQRTRELTAALQAKTQFLSQCSHELRSPLAAIMGLASVLAASPGLTAIQQEHLQTITSSGEDLLALISNILDHSKLESNSVLLENIPFSVRQVVEGALDTVAPVAQSKNVELTAVSMFKNEAPGLMGDPFRVKQVLLNLMSNAVKFTPPSDPTTKRTARVTVERCWEELDDGRIKVTMSVEDNGVGIPASKLHKLFKSFSQVDESITRSYGGSGLGLVISRDLARLLGGDCSVESELGKGSKFTFTFVAHRDPKWKPTPLRRFDTTRKVFILTAPNMVWGRVLEEDMRGFNCSAVRCTDIDACLREGTKDGLASGIYFDFLLLDTSLLTREKLAHMKSLQPNATCIFVSRATEIAPDMERLQIPRESIISRPLKFQSLQDCLVPVPSGPARKTSTAVRKSFDKNLGKEKPLEILVVDDSPVNIAVCTRILELFGYSGIDSAVNGMQATEMAESKRYDIIFLDLQMPVLDGFGALKRIRKSPLAGEPCCVSLSANVDKATQNRCVEAGFYAVLSKPLNIPTLGQILSDAYECRKAASSVSVPTLNTVVSQSQSQAASQTASPSTANGTLNKGPAAPISTRPTMSRTNSSSPSASLTPIPLLTPPATSTIPPLARVPSPSGHAAPTPDTSPPSGNQILSKPEKESSASPTK